ncbi:VTT domain-containing protein [Candidatus Saccharibacteria bacterium]|nr:VTT domain-containing protein [Candidatus Saccharibacteria bacterium]MBI2285638.1 VTT domain-containing protein [Candidatus Saccharibacteria bacterium]HLG90906.1 VTT domain-containing protein [Candidatus Saccharimonadales bacterium]
MLFDVAELIRWGGLLVIAFIVFAESGLLFGFFFPGDTLLLTSGFFAAQGLLPIETLIIIIVMAAVLGDNVGYQTGKHLGPRVFKRRDGIFFRREYVERAERFYEKHGGKTIIIARFFPAIRTFAPIVAGVGKMSWLRFASYNVVGGVLWGVGVTLAGYYIGTSFPTIDHYILPAILIVGHIMLFFILYQIFRSPEVRARLKKALREEWNHYFAKKSRS